MRKKWLGILCLLLLILGACYFYISSSNDTGPLTGIYKDKDGYLRGDFLGNSERDDSKYFAYIEGEFIDKTPKKITNDFSVRKVYFQDLSIDVPDFFETLRSPEYGLSLSLTNDSDKPFYHFTTDVIHIDVIENEDNLTIEDSLQDAENEKKLNEVPGFVRKIQNVTVDGNHIKKYYNGDYTVLEDNELPKDAISKFKVYNHSIYQNDKIYSIEYLYSDDAIGEKVIEILDKSLSIDSDFKFIKKIN